MTNGPTYVLDANVFIQAARRYYAFDVAPRFWDSLVKHASNGQIRSIDRVLKELDRGKDDLAAWVNNDLSDDFASTDEAGVIRVYGEIMAWVQAQSQFTDAAKTDFASGADGWLVAYVKGKGSVVVTQEVFDPVVKRKVPIPNVCQAFGVPYVDTFDMLRRLGIKL
jgi:hypothetical protein